MRTKKIAMFSEAWWPHWGGGQEVAFQLSKELSKLNYKIDIYTMNLSNKEKKFGKVNKNFKIIRIGKERTFSFLNRILWFFELKKHILKIQKKENYDIFYGHSTLPGFYIKYFSKKFKKKAIYHIHGINQIKTKFFLHPFYILEKILSCKIRYDLELTCSNNLFEYKNINNPIFLENGIRKFKDFKKNIKNIRNIIFIGRYDKVKGLDVLIKSCFLVKKDLTEKKIKINLYGYGEEENNLKNLIKNLNLEKIIKINNGIFGKEKEKIFRKADLFIQTGVDEGFGLIFLESIAFKTPLLSTNVGLIKNLKDYENCLKFKDLKEKNISKKFLEVLNYDIKKINKIKEKAFNLVKKDYVWGKISKKLDKYIKKF